MKTYLYLILFICIILSKPAFAGQNNNDSSRIAELEFRLQEDSIKLEKLLKENEDASSILDIAQINVAIITGLVTLFVFIFSAVYLNSLINLKQQQREAAAENKERNSKLQNQFQSYDRQFTRRNKKIEELEKVSQNRIDKFIDQERNIAFKSRQEFSESVTNNIQEQFQNYNEQLAARTQQLNHLESKLEQQLNSFIEIESKNFDKEREKIIKARENLIEINNELTEQLQKQVNNQLSGLVEKVVLLDTLQKNIVEQSQANRIAFNDFHQDFIHFCWLLIDTGVLQNPDIEEKYGEKFSLYDIILGLYRSKLDRIIGSLQHIFTLEDKPYDLLPHLKFVKTRIENEEFKDKNTPEEINLALELVKAIIAIIKGDNAHKQFN